MYINNRDEKSKPEVARYTNTNENEMYRATNNDRNKPLAYYHDGINHPETGEKLKSDFELHKEKSGECIYAQFSDKNDNTYYYIKEDDKSIEEQIDKDREYAQEIEQNRGR